MSFIPTETLNMSQFSLDTGFDSVAGSPDPTYNPQILDGVELGKFFTRQVHHQGKYIEGITVDANGITLPQGYIFVLDPYLFYSGGVGARYANYFIWNIDNVDQDVPKWASNYASDLATLPNSEATTGRGYRGYKIVDTTLGAKVIKLIAKGPSWQAIAPVYFDVSATSSLTIVGNHKSHILIRAIPSADVVGQTVRELVIANDTYNLAGVSQVPDTALNKYLLFNRTTAGTWTYWLPANPQVGDWVGLFVVNNNTTSTCTITSPPTSQTLVSAKYGQLQTSAYMWQWTGVRWVEIPFSSQGLVKLPRA